MSNKYKIFALFTGVALLLSWSANPPDGRTGAPGDGLCSDCHSLGSGMQNGNISVMGLPATITPNTDYFLTVTNSNPNGLAQLAGFQVTILNSNNMIAGTFSNPSPTSTISTSGGRQYWEHNPAQSYPVSNVVMWTVTWKSPTMPANTTITYYAAGNIANGNGQPSGDLIDTDQGSGMLMGGGSNLAVTITNFNDVLCFGQSTGSATASATGGVTPYTYNWSNGATGATANNLAAGTYTVTVTDFAFATATASVTITQPSQLNLNPPAITNVTCNGGNNGSISASANGGVGPYFFSWSNGMNGTTINNLTAGPYTVTVTDDNGCTKTATYQVTQPAVINITLLDLNHESCANAEDGSITISVTGGVNPLFAEWSNGSIGFTIEDLAPDVYTVTVTDNNDCTKTATYTINAGGNVDVNLLQIQHVSCFGGSNGAISVSATGGFTPYTYQWSNGMTGSAITGLTAGNYLVSVTDANGCQVVEGYTVNQPTEINVVISQTAQNLCFGDTTAILTATVSGGQPGYSAVWSDGSTGLVNTNVGAGSYTITVTDASGCTSTESATITQPPQLVLNVVTTDETSAGANNGTASANVAGGVGPYLYSWSQGSTTQTISSLPPGMYCVTITDQNGCTVEGCGQVDAFGCNANVMLGLDQVICEDDTVLLIPTVTGTTGNVTYAWSDGSTGSTLEVGTGGTYCVSITDQANCQDADCIIIIENIIPAFDCPVVNESAPGANDGSINCSQVVFASYLWNTGATTSSISGLSPGQYCVTVTDSLGCTKEQCFNVQPGNCQMIVTSTQVNVLCAGDSTGSISLNVTGATQPITYTWSVPQTTSTVTNLAAGNYSVTVTDAAGCVFNDNFAISEPLPLAITVDSVQHISGTQQGAITITFSGGAFPYATLWTYPNGATSNTEDIHELTLSGVYSVIVTDANGCTANIDSIVVEVVDGIENIHHYKSLKVYPVPADDVLIVVHEIDIEEVLISGIDRRVYKRVLNPVANKLQVDDLEAGWYILRMFDGEHWYVAKMVK